MKKGMGIVLAVLLVAQTLWAQQPLGITECFFTRTGWPIS